MRPRIRLFTLVWMSLGALIIYIEVHKYSGRSGEQGEKEVQLEDIDSVERVDGVWTAIEEDGQEIQLDGNENFNNPDYRVVDPDDTDDGNVVIAPKETDNNAEKREKAKAEPEKLNDDVLKFEPSKKEEKKTTPLSRPDNKPLQEAAKVAEEKKPTESKTEKAVAKEEKLTGFEDKSAPINGDSDITEDEPAPPKEPVLTEDKSVITKEKLAVEETKPEIEVKEDQPIVTKEQENVVKKLEPETAVIKTIPKEKPDNSQISKESKPAEKEAIVKSIPKQTETKLASVQKIPESPQIPLQQPEKAMSEKKSTVEKVPAELPQVEAPKKADVPKTNAPASIEKKPAEIKQEPDTKKPEDFSLSYTFQNPSGQATEGTRFAVSLPVLSELDLPPKKYTELSENTASKFVFVTANSYKFYEDSESAIASVQKYFPDHRILYYDLGLLDEQRYRLKKMCNVEYRKYDYNKYPINVPEGIVRRQVHRAMIIQDVLRTYPGVLYMDSSFRLWSDDLTSAYDVAIKNGGVVFFTAAFHSIYAVTHNETYKYIPSNSTRLRFTQSVQTGAMLIYNTEFVFNNLLWWWYLCTLDTKCVAPIQTIYCDFWTDRWERFADCHRYDQSVVNILLANMYNFKNPKYFHHSPSISLRPGLSEKELELKLCK